VDGSHTLKAGDRVLKKPGANRGGGKKKKKTVSCYEKQFKEDTRRDAEGEGTSRK